jgi:hypothetical protein
MMKNKEKFIVGQLSPKTSKWLISFFDNILEEWAATGKAKEIIDLLPGMPHKGIGFPRWKPEFITWMKSKGYDVWETPDSKILIKFHEKEAVWFILQSK